MRITANITSDNSLYNIQQGRAKLDKILEQLSSEYNINRPSDDPINSRLLLNIGDHVKAADQYASNISKASTWQKVTSTALTGISNTMTLAKTLVASITNGSSDATVRQSAHDQLVELKQQIVDMANTQYGDQYIFGGAKNQSAPFNIKTGNLTNGSSTVSNVDVTGLTAGMQVSGTGIPAGTVIGTIGVSSFTLVDSGGIAVNATATTTGSSLNIYSGDSTQSSIEIAQNSSQKLNITGDRLLKGTGTNPSYGSTDILQTFDNLIAAVGDNTTASNTAGILAGDQALHAGSQQLINAQTDVASRQLRLDSMDKLNANNKNTLSTIYGSIQNADIAKLGVELTQQQTAYNATLSATAKISQMSLLDYLK